MSMTGKLHPADAEAGDVVETGAWYDHGTDSLGHTTSRGRVFGVLPIRYDDCDRYGCNRVVVVDPEAVASPVGAPSAGEGARYIARLLREADENNGIPTFGRLADAFDPTPPIEEPTGLGAVVEDDKGSLWFRMALDNLSYPGEVWQPQYEDVDRWLKWSDIEAVRVLSEGVPAEVTP